MKEILEEYGMTLLYLLFGAGVAGLIVYCVGLIAV